MILYCRNTVQLKEYNWFTRLFYFLIVHFKSKTSLVDILLLFIAFRLDCLPLHALFGTSYSVHPIRQKAGVRTSFLFCTRTRFVQLSIWTVQRLCSHEAGQAHQHSSAMPALLAGNRACIFIFEFHLQ